MAGAILCLVMGNAGGDLGEASLREGGRGVAEMGSGRALETKVLKPPPPSLPSPPPKKTALPPRLQPDT